jgi:iron complex outermembrane recepter protein
LYCRRKTGFLSSRGAEPSHAKSGECKAEIIPVEPEQDNACAGKVAFFSSSAVLHFQLSARSITHLKLDMKSFFISGMLLLATIDLFSQHMAVRDSISTDTSALDTFRIKKAGLFLDPVEITAIRAGDKAPFTKMTLNAGQISKINNGQDLPYILDQTPSVVVSSDAGNGIGYTGISIRGTDASRINMTLNGLPYNDAESQSIYFVDIPDFASSTNSIQIQRGVGTSSMGAGAFGASMNFSTNTFNAAPYAEFNNSFGSFNSWKNTLMAGSGLIDGHFTVDMRLSRISSDGYIDRATSDLKSLYFSAAYISKKTSLRFNIIMGSEKTYQAWNGVPQAKVYGDSAALEQEYLNNTGYPGALYNTPGDSINLFDSKRRTYNYFTYANQTDNYQQNHYQLFLNQELSPKLNANVAAFLTRGKGYYEEYINDAFYSDYGLPSPVIGDSTLTSTNLIRQRWLSNYFYGGIYSFQYKNKSTDITLGGGWTEYDGQHYGNVIWSAQGGIAPDYEYYNDPAKKTDFNVYAKWQQQLGKWFSSYIDLQYRKVYYRINGFDNTDTDTIINHYNFFNPKAGISYNKGPMQAYFSFARATHEPNHDDYQTGLNQQPVPETVNDFELGLDKKTVAYSWGITAYYMLYKNELVLTGKINDVGEYTRTNTPRSYRLGLELQGTVKPAGWVQASGSITVSQNKISNYTSYVDDYDNGGQISTTYNKTDMALSPDIIAAATLSFFPTPILEISLPAKFVGSSYLDNSESSQKKIADYYLQQLRLIYSPKMLSTGEINFIFYLNNVFNKKYEATGYTYGYYSGGTLVNENFLFPQAGTNFIFSVNIRI